MRFKAFTLFELLLVITILSLVTVIAMPFSVRQSKGAKAEESAIDITSAIKTIRNRASSGYLDTPWGIAFQSSRYTVFRGESLATSSNKYTVELSPDVRISNIGVTEVFFEKNSVKPNRSGSIELESFGRRYGINISNEGVVSYSKL